MTNRDSKKTAQIKRKRSSRDLNRKGRIKLDLKTKLVHQRGNTSRNVSIKKRGLLSTKANRSSIKCFIKRKSGEKESKGASHSRRELKKNKSRGGLMGMLKDKVKRSQKSLSRLAQNYQPKSRQEAASKRKSSRKPAQANKERKKAQHSFKLKENRANWQLKLKKKKFGPEKIEKVIRAFDERCKRIDRKLGTSKKSKASQSNLTKKRSISRKKKNKQSIRKRKTPTNRKTQSKVISIEKANLMQSEASVRENSRAQRVHEESKNSEYMLGKAKGREKAAKETGTLSRQASRHKFSIRKIFKDKTESENELTKMMSGKKEKMLQNSGKSTLGLWSSSIRNIHKNHAKLNISKQIHSTRAKDKKYEQRQIKKFLSPERIKSYLLREKPKRRFGDDPSQNFFSKYKRGGSKSNIDSRFEKSRSRVLTGDKTPSSQKNRRTLDSAKNSGGRETSAKKHSPRTGNWDLRIWDMEALLEGLQRVGILVQAEGVTGQAHIRDLLAKVELFLNCFIGKSRLSVRKGVNMETAARKWSILFGRSGLLSTGDCCAGATAFPTRVPSLRRVLEWEGT